MLNRNDEELESDLRAVLHAAERARAREIDAGCCRTRYDFDRAERARDEETSATDAFLAKWTARIRS